MSCDQAHQIGADFFYITAKKFAKSQSIEKYAEFIIYMNKFFGFNNIFLKLFLSKDRDYTEALNLLSHL